VCHGREEKEPRDGLLYRKGFIGDDPSPGLHRAQAVILSGVRQLPDAVKDLLDINTWPARKDPGQGNKKANLPACARFRRPTHE